LGRILILILLALGCQVTLPSGEPQGTISFVLHLKESKSLLAAQKAQGAQDAQETPEILE